MLDLPRALNNLAKRRPIFHSEADFQHELATQLRNDEPAAHLRLEVPFAFEKRGSTDIVVRLSSGVFGIELKYLTKRLRYEHGSEAFELKAQGATDLRRYDILKDVQRLERFNQKFGGPSYVLALTNDSAYWNSVRSVSTIDAAFRLCEGNELTGSLSWADHASSGSIKGREAPLTLLGRYRIGWQPFSDLGLINGEFRYLLLPVG